MLIVDSDICNGPHCHIVTFVIACWQISIFICKYLIKIFLKVLFRLVVVKDHQGFSTKFLVMLASVKIFFKIWLCRIRCTLISRSCGNVQREILDLKNADLHPCRNDWNIFRKTTGNNDLSPKSRRAVSEYILFLLLVYHQIRTVFV